MIDPPYNRKILMIDDEQGIHTAFSALMRRQNVDIHSSLDPTKIDEILSREGPFAVVLSDQRMPGMGGVEVLEHVARVHPDTVRIMVTGFSDYNETLRAINVGKVGHYVKKPWDDNDMVQAVQDAVVRYNLTVQNRFLLDELTRKNAILQEFLDGTIAETTRVLSDLVGFVNEHGIAQVARVRRLGNAVINTVPDLSAEERWEIQRALDLFNLGLAVLPPWIQVSLNKDGLGALERFPVARNHHLLAAEMLKGIPRFDGVATIIRLMLKNFDGSGPPADDTSRGEQIPLGSRLLHILLDLERLGTEHFKGREVLASMLKRTSKYDVALIARMLGHREDETQGQRDERVRLERLEPGMVLLEDLSTGGGKLLLRASTTLTRTSLDILRHWRMIEQVPADVLVRITPS